MRFHHIGIACEDITYMKQYINTLYNVESVSEVIFDELQQANLCLVTLKDQTKIEIVSGKVVEKLVDKRQYLYHTCYSTQSLDLKINEFESMGAKVVSKPKPAKLFCGQRVAFLMTRLGLIELLESKEKII